MKAENIKQLTVLLQGRAENLRHELSALQELMIENEKLVLSDNKLSVLAGTIFCAAMQATAVETVIDETIAEIMKEGETDD